LLTFRKSRITSLHWVLFAVIIIMCILPLLVTESWVSIVAEMLIWSLAGTALNLIFGHCGMVSFGHAGFFGVGAYTFGLLLYYGLASYGVAFISGILAATLFGVIVGWFAIRLISHYFALFVLAASMVIWVIASVWYGVTGGDDGLIGIPVPEMFFSITNSYYFILLMVAICLFILYLIRQSPFGSALDAIRENRRRAESIGINVRRYIYIAFIVSSAFMGIAGILMANFVQCAFTGYADFMKSGEFLFICLLGGMYNFIGPTVGAFVFLFLDKIVTRYTEYWPLVLGCLIVFIALFFRGGIMGFMKERYRVFRFRGGRL
jgi:branched-chain amino acid transport system permease protein